jgi:hypothetical protein
MRFALFADHVILILLTIDSKIILYFPKTRRKKMKTHQTLRKILTGFLAGILFAALCLPAAAVEQTHTIYLPGSGEYQITYISAISGCEPPISAFSTQESAEGLTVTCDVEFTNMSFYIYVQRGGGESGRIRFDY